MEATTTLVSLKELQRVLNCILNRHPKIFLRFRTLGDVWYPNFVEIVDLQESRIEFYDHNRQSSLSLTDFTRIAELEFSGAFESYESNFRYEVSDDHDV